MKAGDKVVFNGIIRGGKNAPPPGIGNYPKPFTEIITIASECYVYPGNYDLHGYLRAKDGKLQSFHGSQLIPLQDWQQAEYMTEELIQETLMPVEL